MSALNLPDTPAWRIAADRRERIKANLANWTVGQGGKIRSARPPRVFDACRLLACDLAVLRAPLVLTAAEIAICEDRAISQARAHRFGPFSKSEAQWLDQCDEIRASWKSRRDAAKAEEVAA